MAEAGQHVLDGDRDRAAEIEARLAGIVALDAAWGRDVLLRALARATIYRRFSAADVRAILAAGSGVPEPGRAGGALPIELPAVTERPLSAYALTQLALPRAVRRTRCTERRLVQRLESLGYDVTPTRRPAWRVVSSVASQVAMPAG